jgi:hypothetical protein
MSIKNKGVIIVFYAIYTAEFEILKYYFVARNFFSNKSLERETSFPFSEHIFIGSLQNSR